MRQLDRRRPKRRRIINGTNIISAFPGMLYHLSIASSILYVLSAFHDMPYGVEAVNGQEAVEVVHSRNAVMSLEEAQKKEAEFFEDKNKEFENDPLHDKRLDSVVANVHKPVLWQSSKEMMQLRFIVATRALNLVKNGRGDENIRSKEHYENHGTTIKKEVPNINSAANGYYVRNSKITKQIPNKKDIQNRGDGGEIRMKDILYPKNDTLEKISFPSAENNWHSLNNWKYLSSAWMIPEDDLEKDYIWDLMRLEQGSTRVDVENGHTPLKVILVVPGHGSSDRWPFLSVTINKFWSEWKVGWSKYGLKVKENNMKNPYYGSSPEFDYTEPQLGCLVYLYKPEKDFSFAEATIKDRMHGNFTSTNCEVRRRIRWNWTTFQKMWREGDIDFPNDKDFVQSGQQLSQLRDINHPNATLMIHEINNNEINKRWGQEEVKQQGQDLVQDLVKKGQDLIVTRSNLYRYKYETFDYILILLDDIMIEKFPIIDYLLYQRTNQLHVSTPYVHNAPGTKIMTTDILKLLAKHNLPVVEAKEDEVTSKITNKVIQAPKKSEHPKKIDHHLDEKDAEKKHDDYNKSKFKTAIEISGALAPEKIDRLFGSIYAEQGIFGWHLRMWEVQLTVFTQSGFDCFTNMIDLETNPIGWGYDVLYYDLCTKSMGERLPQLIIEGQKMITDIKDSTIKPSDELNSMNDNNMNNNIKNKKPLKTIPDNNMNNNIKNKKPLKTIPRHQYEEELQVVKDSSYPLSNIGFLWMPLCRVFHLAGRVIQGLSSQKYVEDDETFPLPKNTQPVTMKLSTVQGLNKDGVGGKREIEKKKDPKKLLEKEKREKWGFDNYARWLTVSEGMQEYRPDLKAVSGGGGGKFELNTRFSTILNIFYDKLVPLGVDVHKVAAGSGLGKEKEDLNVTLPAFWEKQRILRWQNSTTFFKNRYDMWRLVEWDEGDGRFISGLENLRGLRSGKDMWIQVFPQYSVAAAMLENWTKKISNELQRDLSDIEVARGVDAQEKSKQADETRVAKLKDEQKSKEQQTSKDAQDKFVTGQDKLVTGRSSDESTDDTKEKSDSITNLGSDVNSDDNSGGIEGLFKKRSFVTGEALWAPEHHSLSYLEKYYDWARGHDVL